MILEIVLTGGGYVSLLALNHRFNITGTLRNKVAGKLEKKADELIPGVQKPSTVLVEMMALKILEKPDNIYLDYNRLGVRAAYVFRSDKGWSVVFVEGVRHHPEIEVEKCSVKFEASELKTLKAAMEKAVFLKKELDKAKEVERNQTKAVEAIEKWMGVSPNKKETE